MPEPSDNVAFAILVVDDSATERARVTGLLRREYPDALISDADGGAAALQSLQEQPADVVISDLVMPDMDGHALVRQLKKQRRDVACILMTARGNDELAAKSVGIGAVSYISKRTLQDQLTVAVSRALGSLRERRLQDLVHRCVTSNKSEWIFAAGREAILSLQRIAVERIRRTFSISEEMLTAFSDKLADGSAARNWNSSSPGIQLRATLSLTSDSCELTVAGTADINDSADPNTQLKPARTEAENSESGWTLAASGLDAGQQPLLLRLFTEHREDTPSSA